MKYLFPVFMLLLFFTNDCAISQDAYTTEDIIYHWKPGKPVQVKEGLHQSLPSFHLTNVNTGSCTSNTATG